jgi:hypothetical protein
VSWDIVTAQEDFKCYIGKLIDERSHMKFEIQSLKKVGKVMKVRVVNLSSGRRKTSKQEGFQVPLLCMIAKPVSMPL